MITVWFVRTVLLLVVIIIAARSALFLWDYTFEQLFHAQTTKDDFDEKDAE